jgi:hypothetical protein
MADRRWTHRVRVCGSAILHGRAVVAQCRIGDLSIGGIGIRHDTANGFAGISFGMAVQIDIHLDSQRGEWISQRGEVRHVDIAAGFAGVAFASASPRLEDLVEDETLAALEALCLRVVVIDGNRRRRRRLVAALRRAGCVAVEVATPAEGLAAIEQSRAQVAIAAVADLMSQPEGHDLPAEGHHLLSYVSVTHPDVQLALISAGSDAEIDVGDRALASVIHVMEEDDIDLDAQVRRLVATWRMVHPVAARTE